MSPKRCSAVLAALLTVAVTGSLAFAAPDRASAPDVASAALRLERGNPPCAPDSPRDSPLRIWVLPEAGAAPFVQALSEARKSIRITIY